MTPGTSNAPWSVSSQAANTGSFGARSGVIGDSQSSTLSLTQVTTAGTISFARRVSSESGFDFLRFSIDGVQVGSWSGEVPYSTVSFPVTAGTHTFSWTYSKDGSVVSGLDAAFIDNVVFPVNTAGPDDWFAVQANVGDVLTFRTSTPGDGSSEPVNTLNPALALFSGTTQVASGTVLGDGRNEEITFTVTTAGTYLVRVSGQGGTSGEYFLSAAGATGADPAFTVTSTDIANGARTRTIPTSLTVNFNDAVLVPTAQAADLRIDGVPGVTVTVVDGDTLRFNLPPAQPTFFQWSAAVGGNDHWYALTTLAGTWQQTRAAAQALGGELASVTSLAENQFLTDTFAVGANGSLKTFWMGLTDEVVEGTFVWTNGDPFVFSNWAVGEPNNFNNEDYGLLNAVRFGGAPGTWNDGAAGGPFYGIIELDGPPPLGWTATDGVHTFTIPAAR